MKNCLHIYPQGAWHDDVMIVGDCSALHKLLDAIVWAINKHGLRMAGPPQQADVFTNDGEGYSVRVLCVDEVPSNLAVPYTDDVAKERSEKAVWPQGLFKP